eukprot:UN05432
MINATMPAFFTTVGKASAPTPRKILVQELSAIRVETGAADVAPPPAIFGCYTYTCFICGIVALAIVLLSFCRCYYSLLLPWLSLLLSSNSDLDCRYYKLKCFVLFEQLL